VRISPNKDKGEQEEQEEQEKKEKKKKHLVMNVDQDCSPSRHPESFYNNKHLLRE